MIRSVLASCVIIAVSASPAAANSDGILKLERMLAERGIAVRPVAGGCKATKSCREAVELYCSGYSRADKDGDGIPCEGKCSSKAEVDKIKADLGC